MNWLLLFSALAPVIILLIYMWVKDMRQPEPVRWILKAVLYGVGSALLVITVLSPIPGVAITGWLSAAYNAFCMAAIPEESAKLLMLWLLLRKNPYFDERLDGIVYATAVSLGFAGLENIMYLVQSVATSGSFVGTGISRALFAVPGHFFFGVLMGFFYGLASFGNPHKRRHYLWLAWFAPVLAHGLYDTIVMGMGTTSAALSGWLMVLFIAAFNGLRKYSVGLIDEHKLTDEQNSSTRED
ncbi:MAG: PrsW family intramembrane metalloprotease [Paludibacteraceae bacterium]|nr:PrsW family intramembrane metalloprotease [Paludibacteraceae bacterium]